MDVVVLVRWNIPINSQKSHLMTNTRYRQNWHKNRLFIWQTFSMPSLMRQIHENFKVWLFCDPENPDENSMLCETFPDLRFEIIVDWRKRIDRFKSSGNACDPVMFCRMDSDDAYHSHLLSIFSSEANEAKQNCKKYIQPAQGYCLDFASGRIFQWINPSPAIFATIIKRDESDKMPGGRFIRNHTQVNREALMIDGKPLFAIGLHENNIWNMPNSPWVRKEITGSELETVRAEYGIAA